jgi:uncharacterized membrane-anchored protein YhcB (DUF1043 family)
MWKYPHKTALFDAKKDRHIAEIIIGIVLGIIVFFVIIGLIIREIKRRAQRDSAELEKSHQKEDDEKAPLLPQ